MKKSRVLIFLLALCLIWTLALPAFASAEPDNQAILGEDAQPANELIAGNDAQATTATPPNYCAGG